MSKYKILILEDDLETQSKLISSLYALEESEKITIATTILSEYFQVEVYLNTQKENIFDVILLDRDCKAGGSFHTLNFDVYPVNKIIGISSTPPYNEELKEKGVKIIVQKRYDQLDRFTSEVIEQVKLMLNM